MTDTQNPMQGRTAPTPPSTTIAEFDTYEQAQALVDKLSEAKFAVEHVRIVGTGLSTGISTTLVASVGSLGGSRASISLVATSGHLRNLRSSRASVSLGLATRRNLGGLSLVAASGNLGGFRGFCTRVVATCAGSFRGVSARVATHARNFDGRAVLATSEETANAAASKEASKATRRAVIRATVATKTTKSAHTARATKATKTTEAAFSRATG